MASPKTSTANGGFTITEIIVVLSLLAVIASFTLFIGMDSYRGYAFHSERDLIVSTLQKARSQAMNNVCVGATCNSGRAHGVHFGSGQYVVFQGNSFDDTPEDKAYDQVVAASYNLNFSGSILNNNDVVFQSLSGSVSPAATIHLNDPNNKRSSVITINTEGQITWTD